MAKLGYRKGKWQYRGKGPLYCSHYTHDDNGERVMLLIRVKKNGQAHVVTGESWQMLLKAGWKKI